MDKHKLPNINLVIQNYILGIASIEEQQFLNDWLNDNPENRKLLFNEKDLYDASQLGSKALDEIEIQQWIKLQDQISKRKSKTFKLIEILKIAAIVLITLGAGWIGHYLYSSIAFSNKQVEIKHIEATKGQIKEIFLADGTHVWLNSDSKLSFPSQFTANNRQVDVHGEAFFEVTANEKKPFLVNTKNHTVKVVGTQFNICEYPKSKIIEVTLVEGKVKIISGNIIKDLFPGQQSSFNTKTSIVKISEKDLEIYSSWKEGRYEFSNERIGKVFQIIERWWDVKINCQDDSLGNERISGVLKRHKPVDTIFELIDKLIPIEYKIVNDVITVISK